MPFVEILGAAIYAPFKSLNIRDRALKRGEALNNFGNRRIGCSFDETEENHMTEFHASPVVDMPEFARRLLHVGNLEIFEKQAFEEHPAAAAFVKL
jgi:hypothetical protein